MQAPPCRIKAGAAAARKVECDQNPSQALWPRLNGNMFLKAPLSVTGVKPWFRIVQQLKIS